MDRTKLMGLVCGFLDEAEFNYRLDVERGLVDAQVAGEHGVYAVYVQAVHDPLVLGVQVRLPVVVPEGRRQEVAELLIRAQQGLYMGRFELDFGRNLVSFRSTLPVLDGVLSAQQFDLMLRAAIETADQYSRALWRLLFGDDLSPAEAVAEVELA